MKMPHFKIDRKYFWLEFGFIFFISFAISLISDLEYSAYEEHDITKFSKESGYRLVTESAALICYSIYYWGFLKVYVFRRSLIGVILTSFAFVILDRLVQKYIVNWVVIQSYFVSTEMRERAMSYMHAKLVFTFNYPLVSTIFPFTGLAFVVRSFTQDQDMKALKEQQLISELNYLKAQLHPHFFFNTINNIYALALKQSAQTAPMIARLGDMMRYILYKAQQPTVPLEQELAFISDYIEVEKLRHTTNTKIQYDLQDIRINHRIEPLLLLPFIENAFKHGLEEETENGSVQIVICQTNEDLTLLVNNSIPQTSKKGTGSGIGIENARKRLDILYPGRYQLNIHEAPLFYELTLILTNP